ncbi:unnamed protein product [Penicillium salamii]|nr:unnamed protein product [Penicillium salamii]CAG8410551.1 unnamed protein product [Penicillium salamii]
MFRNPRQMEADAHPLRLSNILQPIDVIPWSGLAMWYLGVPIVVGDPMLVVQDDDFTVAIEKFENAGFNRSSPNRTPPPEVMDNLPNPQQVMEEMYAGFKRFNLSCAVFDYPRGDPSEKGVQLYGNLHFPLEPTLVESFVKAAIDEETDPEFPGWSDWDEDLRAWVSMMTGYLEVNNDILDLCPDNRAVEWYSEKFGRIREAKFGPWDRRIMKRLGSGKEMPIDMRGNRL